MYQPIQKAAGVYLFSAVKEPNRKKATYSAPTGVLWYIPVQAAPPPPLAFRKKTLPFRCARGGEVDANTSAAAVCAVQLGGLIKGRVRVGKLNEAAALELLGLLVGEPADRADVAAVPKERLHLVVVDVVRQVSAEQGGAALGLWLHLPWRAAAAAGRGLLPLREVALNWAAEHVRFVHGHCRRRRLGGFEGDEPAPLELARLPVLKPFAVGDFSAVLHGLLERCLVDRPGQVAHEHLARARGVCATPTAATARL
mmetsp:Transcript_74014/g.149131  ORF Transcript_74014/g.149131 Transcript_74014/m.149131 type:complete len:255 (-) Transcript_74014:407-1171(-)